MNMQKEKVLKMSKTMDRALKIAGIVLILMIAAKGVLLSPFVSLDYLSGTIVITDIWGVNIPRNSDINVFRVSMLITMFRSGAMAAILFIASFIFSDINREATPFTKKISSKIKIISLLLIATELLLSPIELLSMMAVMPEVNIAISFNLGSIIVAVIFFCLALVFEYGGLLQKESDEIL